MPRSVADLARRLPLERKVAQLFLFGFQGTDLTAEIFRRLRRLDLGGIVLARANYADPALLGQLGGEATVIADRKATCRPGCSPSRTAASSTRCAACRRRWRRRDLASADEAGRPGRRDRPHAARPQRDRRARPGGGRGLRVGLGPRRARLLRRSRGGGRLRRRGGGRLPRGAPVRRGQALPGARGGRPVDRARPRHRRARPRAAARARPAAVPRRDRGRRARPCCSRTRSTRSTTSPGPARSRAAIATDLLRGELGFAGVAITDDLADPAITSSYSVPDAAVAGAAGGRRPAVHLRAGRATSRPPTRRCCAAVRSGDIPRRRLDEALLRALEAKEDYGLIS